MTIVVSYKVSLTACILKPCLFSKSFFLVRTVAAAVSLMRPGNVVNVARRVAVAQPLGAPVRGVARQVPARVVHRVDVAHRRPSPPAPV